MNTLVGAAEPEQPRPTQTTAWWGFCYHCSCWFNNHQATCSTLKTMPLPWSTGTTNSVVLWPTNTATTAPTGYIINNG